MFRRAQYKPALCLALTAFFLLQALAAARSSAQLVREAADPQTDKNSAAAGARRIHQESALTGDQHWADTAIDVKAGERIQISAKGTLRCAEAQQENGPEGLPRGFRDLLRILPLNQAGRGALIGRIGDADIAEPFLIGPKIEILARVPGRLFLGINQQNEEEAEGSFTVTIDVLAASASSTKSAVPPTTSISGLTPDFLQKFPRRVSDKEGNAGDMTNFLLIGSEAQVQQIFQDAGWVKVDRDTKYAVLHGVLASISKESYLTMPMSVLYLFGRPQDYGFAHAEPLTVVSTRHHLRIWKSPLTLDGQPVWVGAATHDVGFERDKRNNGITHKIDPDIDAEREYVGKSLSETGELSAIMRVLPRDALKEARTATGSTFHSSGEVLVMRIAAPANAAGR
jgi:LssY-like putative type I secretion system component LssY